MPPEIILLIVRAAIALTLYVFLGLVLLYIWRDLRAAGQQIAESQRAPGKLIVVRADGVAMDIEREYPLQHLTSIGRGPGNTIVLPDSFASTEHAHVLWRQGQWWLQDQHSRNGTTLNGVPVSEAVVLSSGDEIGVGRVKLRLHIE